MNIPDCLSDSKSILFAGVGGGFDVFTSLPIKYCLKDKVFVFSNYNGHAKKFTDNPECYPEQEFASIVGTTYVLPKAGVKSLVPMYQEIVNKYEIDTIVAVDGGVDSLMHGDEEGAGTILEDFANLIAIDKVNVKRKLLICAGFGAELEEEVCHHHALQNIAELCNNHGFLGSCSLVNDTEEFDYYKKVCERVWASARKSHVQTRIISAALGIFGDDNLYDGIEANVLGNNKTKNYITPLTSMYWFFDLHQVMLKNVLYGLLSNTGTSTDLLMVYRQSIDVIKKRPRKVFPY